MTKKYDVLCLPPQDKPVYFIVESFDSDNAEANAYYYEEGSCPTNFFLRGVEAIITDGDTDPHGLFDFVRTISPEFLGKTHNPNEEWPKVLPEAFNKTVT